MGFFNSVCIDVVSEYFRIRDMKLVQSLASVVTGFVMLATVGSTSASATPNNTPVPIASAPPVVTQAVPEPSTIARNVCRIRFSSHFTRFKYYDCLF